MKNILVIHQSAELYGSDKTLLVLLSQLDKSAFFPVVVLPFNGPLKTELEKEGIKVVIAPVLKVYRAMFSPKNMLALIKGYRHATKVLDNLHKQHNFDIIYSNTLAVLLGMLYASKRNIKHIWHVHEIITRPSPVANAFPVLLNKFADVVVCNSYATKDNLIKRVKALDSKTIVIHNGLDAEEVHNIGDNATAKEILGFAPHDIVITLLGRIGWFKGHKLLLSTYINHLHGNGLKILFVGSPVPGQEFYRTELEEMIAANGLQADVKIISFTKDLKSIWSATDITAVPSTEAEPFGLVAIEGMLAKKPVVAANHGGLTEIIVNNETGFLVTPNDEEALATAIKKLAGDSHLRDAMGSKGYGRARNNFSLKKYVEEFTALFDSFK